MRRSLAVLAASSFLALAACSGSPAATPSASSGPVEGQPTTAASTPPVVEGEPSETPRPTPTGNGLGQTWTFTSEGGATGTFSVPSRTNKLVERVEAERKRAGGKPFTYVLVDVDNRKGSDTVNMYSIEFVDQDGNQIESADLDDIMGKWRDKYVNDATKYNQIIELQKDLTFFLRQGAKGTAVKIFTKPIRSISRAFVLPNGGFESDEATVKA